MSSQNNRRSGRAAATYRLMLTIPGPGGAEYLKEIITTEDISLHGARIRGRRKLQPDWKGSLTELSSGRQVPVRVVWQAPSSPATSSDYREAALEILAEGNFWGRPFPGPDRAKQSISPLHKAALSLVEAMEQLHRTPEFETWDQKRLMEAVCSALSKGFEAGDFNAAEISESLTALARRGQRLA